MGNGEKTCTKVSYITLQVSLTRQEPRNLEVRMVSALILNFLTSVVLHWDLSREKTSVLQKYKKKVFKEFTK